MAKGAFNYQSLVTNNGYSLNEVASALQKAIRRGEEDNALYWATELDMSGFGNYCWKRLIVVVSEDIGIAEPTLPAQIWALYSMWEKFEKNKGQGIRSQRLFVQHAVSLMSRAKKSRYLCHCSIVMHKAKRDMRPIPDYALDRHTHRGKKMGRGFKHFFEEGAKLENEDMTIVDPYFDKAVEALQDEVPVGQTLFPEEDRIDE